VQNASAGDAVDVGTGASTESNLQLSNRLKALNHVPPSNPGTPLVGLPLAYSQPHLQSSKYMLVSSRQATTQREQIVAPELWRRILTGRCWAQREFRPPSEDDGEPDEAVACTLRDCAKYS
jgi:hypothetical protein